jgi:hypothetical protein
MNMTPFILGWVALGVVVLALAIYRSSVAGHEEGSLHMLAGEAPVVLQQQKLGKKIEHIEIWGKSLTAVLVVYGLVLAGIYLYHAWLQSGAVQ